MMHARAGPNKRNNRADAEIVAELKIFTRAFRHFVSRFSCYVLSLGFHSRAAAFTAIYTRALFSDIITR